MSGLLKHADLSHPVKSFDKELYICEIHYKHLYKNEIPCQAVCNKLALEPIPDEFRHFKKLENLLVSKRILFEKIAIMYGKGMGNK